MTTRSTLAMIASLAISFPAAAQLTPDSNEPIDITAEAVDAVDEVIDWTGNVRAVQGDAILTADRMVTILDDAGALKTMRAIGNVRYFNGKEAVTGDSAVYDAGLRTITVNDNVIATQGRQVMTGQSLIYWVDTGRIQFSAPNGRIRGIFHTNSGSDQS